MNRKNKNRIETRKHQREAKGKFHPRGLARAVVHNMMARDDIGNVNQGKAIGAQSPFAKNWRNIAERISSGG